MKLYVIKAITALVTVTSFVACGNKGHRVIVTNDTELARFNETVELNMAGLSGVNAENAIVLDSKGVQIPSQTYTNFDGETKLLFQATIAPHSANVYTVKAGEREEFPTRAYSRHVPERLDDYAYENNLVAGRIYGPALEDPRTFGSDIWLKSTERLILDEWYKKGDYHHNYGEGMDCYKVSNTLGGGALVPVAKDGRPSLGDNYSSHVHICDGPVRTEAVFEYLAFDVDGQPVSATKVISLDADSRFLKSVTTFRCDADSIALALGAVTHDVLAMDNAENWIAFTEKASDTDDPERDGDISVALVYDYDELDDNTGHKISSDFGHAAIVTVEKAGKPIAVWTGSGWSQGGINSPAVWTNHVKNFAFAQKNPLKVVVE